MPVLPLLLLLWSASLLAADGPENLTWDEGSAPDTEVIIAYLVYKDGIRHGGVPSGAPREFNIAETPFHCWTVTTLSKPSIFTTYAEWIIRESDPAPELCIDWAINSPDGDVVCH